MRVLIGYDGSHSSNAAIGDLPFAGVPAIAEATVLVIDDGVAMDVEDDGNVLVGHGETSAATRPRVRLEALELAEQGRARLQRLFPGWLVRADVRIGVPAWGILARADSWKPDLIVVGSHGQSENRRSILGSVSTKVMTEARCSVRIGRRSEAAAEGPVRAIIGVDGSGDARAAARIVAEREWLGEAMIRVVGVFEHDLEEELEPGTLGEARAANPAHAGALAELERAVHLACDGFMRRGVAAAPVIRQGAPAGRLLAEAADWAAHQIFVGAKGHHFLERSFVGSVAHTVASGADCSVEVVRTL